MAIPFVPDPNPPYDSPAPVAPGVRRLVARNAGPFTMTGTSSYLIGQDALTVVDPGPADNAAALLAQLTAPVAQILVTHTHLDHSPAAGPVSQQSGAQVLAYGPHGSGRTAGVDARSGFEGADWDFAPDRRLADGQLVTTEAGDWTAVHTPGHCSNHLCFFRQADGVLLAGDHLMSGATPIVSPPDGDMAAYIDGLDRLAALKPRLILPAHGAPVTDPAPFIAAVKAHRLAREDKVLAALNAGPGTPVQLLPDVYDDVPKALHPLAVRSLLAHLMKLTDEGRVTADPEPGIEARFKRS